MRVTVRRRCTDYTSYRAARVKSLFNVESGADFALDADLAIDDADWRLGVIVGPSGSGKSSMGEALWGPDALWRAEWPGDVPIVDAIAATGGFDDVTGALAAVGLGTVPTWLRPYAVLSNGERFRADLARIICEAPGRVVVDEFSSVVDRQIARFGALAFQKAWKRTGGQAVLLTCHRDVIDWLEPDWVYDTSTKTFERGSRWRRPTFELELLETDWRYWPLFEPHHYLKMPKMIGALNYIGLVEGELVSHVAVASASKGRTAAEARASRLVVMPEWQGAGVGVRFLNAVAQLQMDGRGRLRGRAVTTIIHTSHPGLCAGLRRDRRWRQVSAVLYGGNKRRSAATMPQKNGLRSGAPGRPAAGYGGHFRAVQGFRYYGEHAA